MVKLVLAASLALQFQTNPPPHRDPLTAVKFGVKTVELSDKVRVLRVKMTIKEAHHVIAKQSNDSEFAHLGPRVVAKGKRPPELRVKFPSANSKIEISKTDAIPVHTGEMEVEIAYPNDPQYVPSEIVIRFEVHTRTICYFPGRYVIPVPESKK